MAQKNLRHLPNCHFVQIDTGHLPFRLQAFDFVYSIEVLHHTPSTRNAFSVRVPLLKTGGENAVWVYPLRCLTETFERFPDHVDQVLSVDSNFTIPSSRQAAVKRFAGTIVWLMEASNRIQGGHHAPSKALSLRALSHGNPTLLPAPFAAFLSSPLVTKVAIHPGPE